MGPNTVQGSCQHNDAELALLSTKGLMFTKSTLLITEHLVQGQNCDKEPLLRLQDSNELCTTRHCCSRMVHATLSDVVQPC